MWIHAVEVTALFPSLRPAPSRCAPARSARSHKTDEHERGEGHRKSGRLHAGKSARTHAGGDVGGGSLCLARLPRSWAHVDRQRRTRTQHAETAASPLRTPRRACTQRTQGTPRK